MVFRYQQQTGLDFEEALNIVDGLAVLRNIAEIMSRPEEPLRIEL